MKTVTDMLKDIDKLIPELPALVSKVSTFEAFMTGPKGKMF